MADRLIFQTPTPIQPIRSQVAEWAGVQWLIKRDDLIHPQISGNKWRKLKYNLQYAKMQGIDTLVTFGGAYSNHLYAVAAAGHALGFRTIGIVRGEKPEVLSPTLYFVREKGMQLAFWPRQAYARKEDSDLFESIASKYAPFYLIPEGGSNTLAVKGSAELVAEINEPFDYLCSACGTGGTLAGLIAGCAGRGHIIGVPVLKGGDFLQDDILHLLQKYYALEGQNPPLLQNWTLRTDYHFGGYARVTTELLTFIRRFEQENDFLIEQVYTAKMLFGIEDMIRQGYFRRGQTIIAIHTGGLQGRLPQL